MSIKRKQNDKSFAPTQSKIAKNISATHSSANTANVEQDMLFNKTTYKYIVGGIVIMLIGFFLMAGGHNDDPNVFDENVIYSLRRTLIAPIFILAGLVVQVIAIFKK